MAEALLGGAVAPGSVPSSAHLEYSGGHGIQRYRVVDTIGRPRAVAVADIDQDNRQDIIVASESAGAVVWYRNGGAAPLGGFKWSTRKLVRLPVSTPAVLRRSPNTCPLQRTLGRCSTSHACKTHARTPSPSR